MKRLLLKLKKALFGLDEERVLDKAGKVVHQLERTVEVNDDLRAENTREAFKVAEKARIKQAKLSSENSELKVKNDRTNKVIINFKSLLEIE